MAQIVTKPFSTYWAGSGDETMFIETTPLSTIIMHIGHACVLFMTLGLACIGALVLWPISMNEPSNYIQNAKYVVYGPFSC